MLQDWLLYLININMWNMYTVISDVRLGPLSLMWRRADDVAWCWVQCDWRCDDIIGAVLWQEWERDRHREGTNLKHREWQSCWGTVIKAPSKCLPLSPQSVRDSSYAFKPPAVMWACHMSVSPYDPFLPSFLVPSLSRSFCVPLRLTIPLRPL